jgi:hypothetical protein
VEGPFSTMLLRNLKESSEKLLFALLIAEIPKKDYRDFRLFRNLCNLIFLSLCCKKEGAL